MAGDAVLLASELVTNALIHSRTGRGGTFEVVVWSGARGACVAVIDDGSTTVPARAVGPESAGQFDVCGRGLFLVEQLSTRWGHRGGPWRRTVWFRMDWPPR